MKKDSKARLYDALQVAIKFTLEQYKEYQKMLQRESDGELDTPTKAFAFGKASAYESVIEDLERWVE